MAIPCRADDLGDSPEFRARMTRLVNRYDGAINDTVNELNELGLVEKATAEVHTHHAAPLFKLYIINGEEAFFGFYPVVEHALTVDAEPQTIYDLRGKDAMLFHHSANDDDTSTGSPVRRPGPHLVRQHVEHRIHGVRPVTPPIDDVDAVRRILSTTEALLLDFDGPICSVFAVLESPSNRSICLASLYRSIIFAAETCLYGIKTRRRWRRAVSVALRRGLHPSPNSTSVASRLCGWQHHRLGGLCLVFSQLVGPFGEERAQGRCVDVAESQVGV